MTAHFLALSTVSTSCSMWAKRGLTLTLIAASLSVQAAPTDMGSITVTSSNASAGTASGTYIAAGSGATGSFTLVRNENIGYNSNAEITPASGTRTNGIEIRNDSNTSIDKDKFKYTFTITPDDNTSIHTIKIGQASYSTGGNSEIGRQTLNFTQNSKISIPAQATIKNNSSVPYFYNAMGDYFMGSKLSATQLNSQNTVSNPQLRTDSSNASGSGLYYYNIPSLAGATSTQNPYSPTLTNNQVTLNSNNGVLPLTPTFDNIIKSINNGNTYSALSANTTISNGGTYVSYGIANSASTYVVAVKNANTVTLTYDGIMNGNIGIPRAVVGETYNEWISFGVESTPLNYIFSGTVFNDNGAINDINAKADTIGGIYTNSKYFNGKFDNPDSPDNTASSAPYESGIAGSTVKLVDCTTGFSLKDTVSTDSNGKYEIIIPITSVASRSEVCLIEEMSGSSYPIRTTTNEKMVNLVQNTYSYKNINFGRVIEANKALVLEKEQAVNSCTINSLTTLAYSKDPVIDVPPGQCIAYKITATNRANQIINNFQMQDNLQKAGVGNATVSSVLTIPIYNPDDYAPDSVKEGKNDVPVKTKPLVIAKRSSNIFYFNTKYGSTNSNP